MSASEYTDANTVAELCENSFFRDADWRSDAATYRDDAVMNQMFLLGVRDHFAKSEVWYEAALLEIFQALVSEEPLPEWAQQIADQAARERFE